jgi:hypothetical protein
MRRDIEVRMQEFWRVLEFVSDPTFEVYEEWQHAESKLGELEAENKQLREQIANLNKMLRRQELEFEKQLNATVFDLRVKIGSLEAKRKIEHKDAERAIKKANRR